MEQEVFMRAVKSLDRQQGNYPFTKSPKAAAEREQMLESTSRIIRDLFSYLVTKNIKVFVYEKLFKKSGMNCFASLFLPDYNIYIVSYNGDTEENMKDRLRVFLATCHRFYPFFIEEKSDSLTWTITKLKNCIKEAEKSPKKGVAESPILPERRKRVRIQKYEKVERKPL